MLMEKDQVILPKSVLDRLKEFFIKHENENVEYFCLLVGKKEANSLKIMDVWIPEQYNDFLSYYISDLEVHRIFVELSNNQYDAIAQVHTHPSYAFHSLIDDEFSILSLSGSYSIVIPDFGRNFSYEMKDWAFFRLQANRWVKIPPDEVKIIFRIVS